MIYLYMYISIHPTALISVAIRPYRIRLRFCQTNHQRDVRNKNDLVEFTLTASSAVIVTTQHTVMSPLLVKIRVCLVDEKVWVFAL